MDTLSLKIGEFAHGVLKIALERPYHSLMPFLRRYMGNKRHTSERRRQAAKSKGQGSRQSARHNDHLISQHVRGERISRSRSNRGPAAVAEGRERRER